MWHHKILFNTKYQVSCDVGDFSKENLGDPRGEVKSRVNLVKLERMVYDVILVIDCVGSKNYVNTTLEQR